MKFTGNCPQILRRWRREGRPGIGPAAGRNAWRRDRDGTNQDLKQHAEPRAGTHPRFRTRIAAPSGKRRKSGAARGNPDRCPENPGRSQFRSHSIEFRIIPRRRHPGTAATFGCSLRRPLHRTPGECRPVRETRPDFQQAALDPIASCPGCRRNDHGAAEASNPRSFSECRHVECRFAHTPGAAGKEEGIAFLVAGTAARIDRRRSDQQFR